MSYDVFISHHTSSSLHLVEAITNRLESAGIRCWYAPRNTTGKYAASIAEAIGECKIFLLILNQPSSESFDVLNEINMACERLRRKEEIMVLPFHVADNEISSDAKYYLGRMHWIDAMTPPMYQRIEELVEKIQVMLGNDLVQNHSMKIADRKMMRLISKMPPAREVFEGRDLLLEKIHETFDSGKQVVFLEGIGGIGKSELAKQYAARYKDSYDTTVFAVYKNDLSSLLCDDEAIMIENLDPRSKEEDDEAYFARKLAALQMIGNERTLFIIDNFDVNDDPNLKKILEGNTRIIFTTRNAHPGYPCIRVEAMEDEGVLFRIFEQNYGDCVYEEDREILMKIFRMISCHTYMIELIAKQMAASFLTAQEMLDLLTEGGLQATPQEEIEGRANQQTAFGHLCSLFNTGGLSEDEKQIMRVLSLVGHSGLPAQKLKEWAGLKSFDVVNQLIRKSWIRRENGQRLTMHPLVREVVHSELKPDQENTFSFLEQVLNFCWGTWRRPIAENLVVADAIQAITEYFTEPKGENYYLFDPYYSFLWQVGRFDASIKFGHRVYEATKKVYGEASVQSGYIARSLAGCYFNGNRRKESIPYYKAGLQHMIDGHVEENEDVAICYEKVARCYTWEYEQDFEKAEELFRKAEETRLRMLQRFAEGDPPTMLLEKYSEATAYGRLGEGYFEMGRMYQCKGDYEKALEYARKYSELAAKEEDNRSGHAYAFYEFGVCYYHLGLEVDDAAKTKEYFALAIENLEKALAINIEMRGNQALDVMKNYRVLGDVYKAEQRYGEASNSYMAALSIAETLLGQTSKEAEEIKQKMDFNK